MTRGIRHCLGCGHDDEHNLPPAGVCRHPRCGCVRRLERDDKVTLDELLNTVPDVKPDGTENTRARILRTAEGHVNGDRNIDYGDPRQDFTRTAAFWTAYLGVPVEAHDVAAMMALLKVSRIRWSPTKEDHWVDLAGYAACGAHCSLGD